MYCPNCGKSDQSPESYCRSCGEFLTDYSGKSYLINKLLGGSTPETQINVSLTINAVTAFVSSLLLGFLNGYFDAQYERTGQSAPPIIYLVYIFLALVFIWQFLSFVIGTRLKKKLSGRKKVLASVEQSADENVVPTRSTQKPLPQADFENVVPASVAEETTKILDESLRK